MKQSYKNIFFTSIVLFTITCFPMLANAQDLPPIDPDVPIDGGLSLLVAAGIGYGAKKIKDKKK